MAAATVSAEEGPVEGTVWCKYLDDDGDAYYYNSETQETQWNMPDEVASVLQSAQP